MQDKETLFIQKRFTMCGKETLFKSLWISKGFLLFTIIFNKKSRVEHFNVPLSTKALCFSILKYIIRESYEFVNFSLVLIQNSNSLKREGARET